jgi:hypothetical protein
MADSTLCLIGTRLFRKGWEAGRLAMASIPGGRMGGNFQAVVTRQPSGFEVRGKGQPLPRL